jgi:hypothetical protein
MRMAFVNPGKVEEGGLTGMRSFLSFPRFLFINVCPFVLPPDGKTLLDFYSVSISG